MYWMGIIRKPSVTLREYSITFQGKDSSETWGEPRSVLFWALRPSGEDRLAEAQRIGPLVGMRALGHGQPSGMAGVRLLCCHGGFAKHGGSKGRVGLSLRSALGDTSPVGSRVDGDLCNTPGAAWVYGRPKSSRHAKGARVQRKKPKP